MTFDRRLLTPHIASTSIGIHDAAKAAYQVWSSLPRQFDTGVLSSREQAAFLLDPLHATKDRRGCFHVFAGFDAYQALIASLSPTQKSRVTMLCYSDLDDPAIERYALRWLANFVKNGCLDRRNGLEQLRSLLNAYIDKRDLEQVFGASRMSRSEFARRAGVSPSVLKAQANRFLPKEQTRVTAKDYVLERLE